MSKLLHILLIISILAINSLAAAEMGIVNKELIDSSYGSGIIGKAASYIGLGDRLYEVTYTDGTKQVVFERSHSPLSKATIVEAPSTLWQTAGKPVPVNIRVRGVDLPLFKSPTGTTTHRFELDDITDQYRWITTAEVTGIPTNSYQTVTLTIPQNAAGQRTFLIKEFVKTNDGRWIPGAESQSSDATFNVIWTQSQQSQTPSATVTIPAPTVTPTNTYYQPPAPATEILIDSNPQGAFVQLGGAAIGRTPILITLFSTDGTRTLILSKSGYQTKTSSITTSSPNPLMITLDPLSSTLPTTQPTSQPTTTSPTTPPPPSGTASETLPPLPPPNNSDEQTGYMILGVVILIVVISFLLTNSKSRKKR